MKILKTFEKATLILAVVLVTFVTCCPKLFVSKNSSSSYSSSTVTTDTTLATALLSYFILGIGIALLILIVGAFISFSSNKMASKIGDALVLTIMVIVFGSFISSSISGSAAVLSLIACISYIVSWVLKSIDYAARRINNSNLNDPSNDKDIQLILKWKKLLEDDIISKEEYEEKRRDILKLRQEQVENK